MNQIALLLSGGGARGAYQAGVVQGIHEVLKSENIPFKVDHFSGVSAGAINASFLASQWNQPEDAVKNLVDLWATLKSSDVFLTDAISLGKIGLKWMGELSFGGMSTAHESPAKALLDTAPLKSFLHEKLSASGIEKNIQDEVFKSLIITAVDYYDSTAVSFIQSKNEFPKWEKPRRISEPTKINADHVLCSSAIPLLFPPRSIVSGKSNNERFFGDGCVRNSHPCSPSIHMGANKIILVGVKSKTNVKYDYELRKNSQTPSVARVVNVLLNSILLDNVEHDIERIDRMNQIISAMDEKALEQNTHMTKKFKKIDYVYIAPSKDIGSIAAKHVNKIPRVIRYLIKGLGNLNEANELISYLSFESAFCSELIEIGFQDALEQKENLINLYSQL